MRLLSEVEQTSHPDWFIHFIELAKKIIKMFKSSWGNKLDTTRIEIQREGKIVSVEQWDSDMRSVMVYLEHGANNLNIPISPLVHTLCHIYQMLKNDPSHGFGNAITFPR